MFGRNKYTILPLTTMNHKTTSLLAALALAILLQACDCWPYGDGIVIDSSTRRPLDSVSIKAYLSEVASDHLRSEMTTDSTGTFQSSGGNTGFCKDLIIVFTKPGYRQQTFSNPLKDTIRLVKE